MSSYAVKNLMDADDSAAGRGADMEMRFTRKHLDSQELGVTYVRYGPGFKNSAGHSHKVQEEAYVVVSGSGQVRVGDDVVDIAQWDVVRVAPETVRAFAAGPDGLELIAVGGHKPAEGDGVLHEDWWTD